MELSGDSDGESTNENYVLQKMQNWISIIKTTMNQIIKNNFNMNIKLYIKN